MDNQKIRSVILYALGEIFLVVIGILIAVQLNNWNNQRKLEFVEETTLNRLLEDLKIDFNRFNFLDSSLNYRVKRCDTLITLLNNQTTRANRLEIIGTNAVTIFLLEPNTTTYDEMLNTGRLYSLSDNGLRSEIMYYYRSVEKWGKYAEENNEKIRKAITQPQLNDYWVLQEKMQRDLPVNFEKYPWLSNQYSRELRGIEHLIYLTRINQQENRENFLYLRRVCKRLIERLEARTN